MSSLDVLIDVALIAITMIAAGNYCGLWAEKAKKEQHPPTRIRLF